MNTVNENYASQSIEMYTNYQLKTIIIDDDDKI